MAMLAQSCKGLIQLFFYIGATLWAGVRRHYKRIIAQVWVWTNLMTTYQKIILLLRSAGSRGVNSNDFTMKHRVKMIAKNIAELKEAGFKIVTRRLNSNNTIDYILLSEPPKPKEIQNLEMEWDVFMDAHGRWTARLIVAPTIKKSEQEGLL